MVGERTFCVSFSFQALAAGRNYEEKITLLVFRYRAGLNDVMGSDFDSRTLWLLVLGQKWSSAFVEDNYCQFISWEIFSFKISFTFHLC